MFSSIGPVTANWPTQRQGWGLSNAIGLFAVYSKCADRTPKHLSIPEQNWPSSRCKIGQFGRGLEYPS
jgi:hypothetical protein